MNGQTVGRLFKQGNPTVGCEFFFYFIPSALFNLERKWSKRKKKIDRNRERRVWGQRFSGHTHSFPGLRVRQSGLSACGRLYVSKFIYTTITLLLVMVCDDKG